MKLEQAWGRPSSEFLPARQGAASGCPPGHAGSELTRASETLQAWRELQPRVPPLSPSDSCRRRPALATNFAQVSGAGAPAPLSERWPRSVRPRVRGAGAPVSGDLRPQPSRGGGADVLEEGV
jgi:hypothetical protein